MTDRLYYIDAYRTDFTANIVEHSADGQRVYLDATAFYPTSGGQLHDTGTLGGVQVVDVVDEDDRIAHVLASTLDTAATPGTSVPGTIDWTRRFDHMQQHTGQHLLSAVFEDLFGYRTASVHFGSDHSTLDLESDAVTHAQLLDVEARANALVAEARPVAVTFEDVAAATGLRKPSDRGGTLRIVSIDAVDRSACGGTHVRSTAEIGAVVLRATEKVRRATRVQFLCGARAIGRARRDFEALSRMATMFSAAPDDLPALLEAQTDRLKQLEAGRKKLEQDLASYRARELYAETPPDATGVRTIVVREAVAIADLRALAQAALALPQVVLVGSLTSPPSVLFASSDDSGVDAGRVLKALLAEAGGRGGGSPRLAQGSLPDVETRDAVVARLVSQRT